MTSRRRPRLRTVRQPRRLGCGHHAEPGTTVVSRGRTWLCPLCQPWLPVRTVPEILAAALAADDDD